VHTIDRRDDVCQVVGVPRSLEHFCTASSMFKRLSTHIPPSQRLLLAVVVVLAPFCADLPCCCERASAANIASCCAAEPSGTSCCASNKSAARNSASGTAKACCRGKIPGSSKESSVGSRLKSCQCCFEVIDQQSPVITTRLSSSISDQSFAIASLHDEWLHAVASLEFAQLSGQFAWPINHNRLQATLCVWRN